MKSKKYAYEKFHAFSRILGSKKLVFCPLHKDKVPSQSINHQKNLWRCFGCGKDRNLIQLVMEMEGINFMAAVRRLCNKKRLARLIIQCLCTNKGFEK